MTIKYSVQTSVVVQQNKVLNSQILVCGEYNML